MVEHGRVLVAYTDSHAYFTPAEIHKNPDEHGVDLMNVFAGLQLYQAIKNTSERELTAVEKIGHLLEIFKNPNDFVSLAKTVETQTGVTGLMKAVLESFSWAKWEMMPQLGDVTEGVSTIPHISVRVSLGEDPLMAGSLRQIKLDEAGKLPVKACPEFRIFRGGKELGDGDETDGNDALPDFELRFVQVLPNKGIAFDGDENLALDDYAIFEKAEKDFLRYILTDGGEIEYDVVKKFDERVAFVKALEEVKKTGSSVVLPKSADGSGFIEIKRMVEKDPVAKGALVRFLLPYCDMPTISGPVYILPGEE